MTTLYWAKRSSAIRALWLIEELGLDYDLCEIGIHAEPRQDPKEFVEASPLGKVPALREADEMLSGSAAICLYLADRHGAGRFAPRPDDPGRARYLYWMFFTPASIEPAMAEKFMGLTPNKVAAPWGTWDLMIETLEKGLSKDPFIAGDSFTASDVMIAASCRFLHRFQLVEPSPAMSSYMDRCMSRPAYLRAARRDDA